MMMESKPLYQTFLNKAVQLLAQRNHSSTELKQKLSIFYLKKLSTDVESSDQSINAHIDAVIAHCLSHHWLDDKQYIEQYINMRSRKGYGQNRILMELKQRGLPRSLIQYQLQQSEIDWIEVGLIQTQKKFRVSDKKDLQQKIKIFQFLTYRGFQQDEIKQIYSLF